MAFTIPAFHAGGPDGAPAPTHSPRTDQGDGKGKKQGGRRGGGGASGGSSAGTSPGAATPPTTPPTKTSGRLAPIKTARAAAASVPTPASTSSSSAHAEASQARLDALAAELGRLQRAQSTLKAALAAGAGVAISPRAGGVPAGLADILAAAEPAAAKARAHAARGGLDPAIAAADAAAGLPPGGGGPPPAGAGLLDTARPPKAGAVSAGLTGFHVAADLLKLDFSAAQPPTPEAYVAPRWDAPPAPSVVAAHGGAAAATAAATAAAAASVAADPTAMAAWLTRLETQHRVIMALLEAALAGKKEEE